MSTELTESVVPAECVGGVSVLRFFGGEKRGMCFQFATEDGTLVLNAADIKRVVKQNKDTVPRSMMEPERR